MRPWIAVTRQNWKLVCFLGLSMIGLGCFVLMILALNNVALAQPMGELRSAIFGIGFAAAAFVWLCYSVRCHECHGRPAWYLVRTAPVTRWLTILLTCLECPSCGHRPA